LRRYGLWLAGFVVWLLLLPRPADAQFLSPGPLSAAHAKWDGDDKCETCHSAGSGVPNGKCNACHEPIAKAEASGTGLHGRKFKGQPCAKCHSDHHGRGFAMVRFAPSSFNHAESGWPLRGAHATTKCASCHESKSYLGLSQSCTSCHKDPHQNRFGAQCLTCHDEASWSSLRLEKLDHDSTRYPLRGAHASVKCQACHQGSPPKYEGLEFSTCTSCHQDPHQGKLGKGCESCHTVADWRKLVLTGNAHPWLSLANGHARTGCAQCHDRGNLMAPSRGRACVGCHKPVHEADFGRRCESCHGSIRWLGLERKVGLAAHAQTPYPLRGKHANVPCAACHEPSMPENTRYRELEFARCASCHDDPHEKRFAARDGGECSGCHSEAGFRPSRFGIDQHATTRLPLTGHHAAVACSRCHERAPSEGRRLVWAMQKTRCADCHENPHGPQFAEEMRKNGCATCHTSAGWDVPKIDHGTWPLTGAHVAAPCAACHQASEQDRKAGKGPSYRQAPRACEGCHDDVHRGQFRLSEPKRSCDFCHTTPAFAIRAFEHEARAGYPLAGNHRALECAKCHQRESTAAGATAVRYRLGYRRCRDCHADPHAPGEP
jgi:Doubled CXXCH motif (Paired_CXXCH_1)